MKEHTFILTLIICLGIFVQFAEAQTPPEISNLPDYTIYPGDTIPLINLSEYAYDAEDSVTDLKFVLYSESNPGVIDCYITGNRYLGCGEASKTGFSDITVEVIDTDGFWDMDTFTINVIPPQQHPPQIKDIEISPPQPDEYDDLTCKVWVVDEDADLKYVKFKWYREYELVKIHTEYVSGDWAAVEDILDNEYTHQGDVLKCRAWVYDSEDNTDYRSETVEIQTEPCGVDVYSLDVTDNTIQGKIKNTGNEYEEIDYWFYVDGNLIKTGETALDPGETATLTKVYNFQPDKTHTIKLKAVAECGASDSEIITHYVGGECQEKWLDEYRCSGKTLQRLWQSSTCETQWLDYEYCPYGCENGMCIYPEPCGINIESFNYPSVIPSTSQAYFSVTVKNTGKRKESITVRIYIDGNLKESHTFPHVNPGDKVTKVFYHTLFSGIHTIKIDAISDCGAVDERKGSIEVKGFEPQEKTKINIYPGSVDTKVCRGTVITLEISTPTAQDFSVNVKGVPQEWLSYKRYIRMKAGSEKFYIYITPQETGKYILDIKVKALEEAKEYNYHVYLYSAPETKGLKTSQKFEITGLQILSYSMAWVVFVIIAAVITLAIGIKKLKYS